MASPDALRDRKRKRTHLEIARTALDLFSTKGYDQTTVELIAETAEYSKSTFFRYFGSKEDVAFVGVPEIFAEFESAISESRPGLTSWEHISLELIDACRRLAELGPHLEHDQIELWLSEPALDRKFRWLCKQWEEMIAVAYAANSEADADRDLEPQLVARSMIAAAQAGFHLHLRTGTPLPDLVREGLTALGRGLGQ